MRRVAVVIPAKNEAERIGSTIRAARLLPHVDLVVVVDDGSEDDTSAVAREHGASVVRHATNRGKAAAMETGAAAVAMQEGNEPASDGEITDAEPHALLFLDADLGQSAIECAPLVDATVDCAIAYLPPQAGAGGHGIVTGTGRKAIAQLTGWEPQQPLSGQRCITREAFNAALPLASGWGVEVGMTIDLLVAGFTLQEVPCDLRHRVSTNDWRGQLHRADQLKDVLRAVAVRRLRKVSVPADKRGTAGKPGEPFNAYRR